MRSNCFAESLRLLFIQLPILSFFFLPFGNLLFLRVQKKISKKSTFKGFSLKDPPTSDRALIKRGLLRCARRCVYAVEMVTPFGHISDPKGCAVGEAEFAGFIGWKFEYYFVRRCGFGGSGARGVYWVRI